MKETFKKFTPYILFFLIVIVIYHLLNNFVSVMKALSYGAKVLSPIWIGYIIFYIANIPMKSIEHNIFSNVKNKTLKRLLSLVTTILILLALINLVIWIILPRLAGNVTLLSEQIQTLIKSVSDYINSFIARMKIFETFGEELEVLVANFYNSFSNTLSNFIKGAGSYVTSLISGIYSGVMAIALAIYMLIGKEKITRHIKIFSEAYISKKITVPIRRYLKVLDKSFEVFIRGQIVEGIILGVISYILMLIFKFEFPLVISFIIGVTNVIPILGPYIGGIPSFLLLLAVNPFHALLFIPYIIALQQLEGNVIYPRVVGDAMGISGLYIMIVVIVGNGFFGIAGILLGIPLFSAVYTIIKENIVQKKKEANAEQASEQI